VNNTTRKTTPAATKRLPFEVWTGDGFHSPAATLAAARRVCDGLAADGVQTFVYRAEDMEVVYDPCE
jgi:hypothetical protein